MISAIHSIPLWQMRTRRTIDHTLCEPSISADCRRDQDRNRIEAVICRFSSI